MSVSRVRSVKGLVALVTGGASGLGKATVQRLVQNGAKVCMADLAGSKGDELVPGIGSNEQLFFSATDVTSEEDVAKTLQSVKDNFGRLDAIVNCAGVGVAFKVYNFNKKKAHLQEDFDKVQRVNVAGTFNVVRQGVGLIGENPIDEDGYRGVVINTASVAAFDGQIGQTAYSASKGAIVAMTLPLARDLGPHGIRVNAVAPGLYDTPLLQSLPEKVRKFLGTLVPFPNRLGHPDEFAHAVQYLIENPMMNGECLRVDGGLRMPP